MIDVQSFGVCFRASKVWQELSPEMD